MKKILGVSVAVIFLAVAMLAFANPQAPQENITFSVEGGKKAPVTFSHTQHASVASDCKSCHHKWNGEGTPHKCDSCHKLKKDGNVPKIMDAGHKKCRKCHRDMKKAGKKTGPTPCKGCHKK